MIDFLHLPKPQNGYVDYFPGFSNTTGGSWEVWNKPRGINFVKIICIGGGGGGGKGEYNATTTNRGGGGGGGGSSMMTIMLPAIFLPDRLYVSSGVGGIGGRRTSATILAGTSGIASYVSIAPSTAAIYTVCYCNPGDVGSPGAPYGNGGGGNIPATPTIANTLQSGQGNFTVLNGPAGASGGGVGGAVGSNLSFPTSGILLSGGAGGAGGAGFAGGDVIPPASQTDKYTIFSTLPGGAAGTAGSLAGGDGQAGINNMELLLFSGGSGGGSGFDGTIGSAGGNGGDGGFGCGGGGGGAGYTGPITQTDGAGGNGGPGLVIISCW